MELGRLAMMMTLFGYFCVLVILTSSSRILHNMIHSSASHLNIAWTQLCSNSPHLCDMIHQGLIFVTPVDRWRRWHDSQQFRAITASSQISKKVSQTKLNMTLQFLSLLLTLKSVIRTNQTLQLHHR